MQYTIARILKEAPVEGRFGQQIRTAFTTNETGTEILSSFSKYNLKIGQQLEGEVTTTEKDGRTYKNFNFAKKNTGGVDDHTKARIEQIYQEVVTARQSIVMLTQLLQEKGTVPSREPAVDSKTAFDDLDEVRGDDVNPEDIPW